MAVAGGAPYRGRGACFGVVRAGLDAAAVNLVVDVAFPPVEFLADAVDLEAGVVHAGEHAVVNAAAAVTPTGQMIASAAASSAVTAWAARSSRSRSRR